MSVQRRRGQAAVVYPTIVTQDARGNSARAADLSSPIPIVAAFVPQRSGRGEVPGQAQIEVVRMLMDPSVENIDLWSRVDWNGHSYDVAAPPAYHHGTRHTRHWSVDLRLRP